MAYLGTTEASSLQNPPRNLVGPFSGPPKTTSFSTGFPSDGAASPWRSAGGGLHVYVSSHGTTEIQAANFFTEGFGLGIKPLDVIMHVGATTEGSTPILSFLVVDTVSTAGVSLHTAAFISSTYG